MADLIEPELDLPASPEAVWQALTDPAWLQEWLADEAELELAETDDGTRLRVVA
jgi:uncharacterized protein YndB with AHSA1/START domain